MLVIARNSPVSTEILFRNTGRVNVLSSPACYRFVIKAEQGGDQALVTGQIWQHFQFEKALMSCHSRMHLSRPVFS